ncbi:PREDICTED: nucleolar protein 11 [Ceratosolen solmsi marchali]|uniref:Nucleolar protein 11 n=1 Tax=Ceratosolen solmsi marchali TaxID=326594 RepID=A0AAJ6YH02_9HYME|nr:PREDICTED: nucleolar protein 11 [Ceratosolen solmsi marchali]
MARLNSYYTLCPLIDQQNLLGVEADSNPGCAIVTLGRNIVIRYKLQSLKQVSSWSSKERLTTKVIFDETSKNYVAAFNGKSIRIWQENETSLDNVKKYKVLSSIHTILTLKNVPPILVMQNGATVSLKWALENRKTWNSPGILESDEKILNCQLVSVKDKIYLCALVKLAQVTSYIVVPLKNENYIQESDQIVRIELKRASESLVGHVVMQDENNAYLLTLWSHGRLYNYPLINSSMDSIPGSLISVITSVNTKYPVVMVALNESTIAAYGADAYEEGAVLLIYNVQFKLVQAVQKLKLFTSDAKLWKIEDKLLLAANRHLAIAPYYLAEQRIEAMLGSTLHFKNQNFKEDNEIVVIQESTIADWGTSVSNKINHVSLSNLASDVATQVSNFLREGMSDAIIHRNLIPKLIENKDIASIIWCLDNLKDLPEDLLIQVLGFCLRSSCDSEVPTQNGFMENSQKEFLNKILSICYTDVSLISHLRIGLNFDEILKLLNYLINKLNDESSVINNHTFEFEYKLNSQLYEWTKLLIDSHYQHYLLSRDIQVLKLFDKLNEALEIHLQLIRDLENLRPMIKRLMSGKLLKSTPNDINRFYSIEEIKFY